MPQEAFESIQSLQSLRSQRRQSKLISRQVFNEHQRKKRRAHTNSIFNQLKICDKLNQFKIMYQENQRSGTVKKNRMCKIHQSQIFGKQNNSTPSLFYEKYISKAKSNSRKQNKEQTAKPIKNKEQKTMRLKNKEYMGNTIKNNESMVRLKKNKKYNFGNIQFKLKQLKKISQAFDQVNNIPISLPSQKQLQYKVKYTQTDQILKDFSQKLTLRKNMITNRKDSLKKNVIRDYRFKAMPKKIYTQQNQCKIFQNNGIWFQNAQKLKNYISGGYCDQREQFSDLCCLQQYRKIKKNFIIFENIYNSIKEDRTNPINKINTTNFKNPTTLQVVSYLQRYSEAL